MSKYYLIDLGRRKLLAERDTREEIEQFAAEATTMPTIEEGLKMLDAVLAVQIYPTKKEVV